MDMLSKGLRKNFNKQLTMLDKGAKNVKNDLSMLEKGVKNVKNDLTMLERGLANENETKMLQRKKKIIQPPAKEKKVMTELSSPHDDKFLKLQYYAGKYKIPFTRSGVKKSYKNLAEDIHKHEMLNIKNIIKNGLDKKYKEYGHYINII